jgi:hypothetical protein
MHHRILSALSAALVVTTLPAVASAVVLFSDDFNTAGSAANYNTYITPGSTGPSGDVTFAYNYGAAPGSGGLSIPVAPHTTGTSTIGVRVRTDNLQSSVGTVVGATSISTKNLSLPSTYTLQVDVWSNYIGGTNISASGTNGSTGVYVGLGTFGNSIQYIGNGLNDGLLVGGFGDNGGGTNQAYRVYTNGSHPNPTTKAYWAAGTSANSATFSDPYYTAKFPSASAPSGQSTFASTQGGSTPAGVLGFAWHTWTLDNNGTNVTWAIDGFTIATIPLADFTRAGSQISLGNDDTGLSGSSTANNQLFNAQIFDNLVITAVPEAGGWVFGAVAAVAGTVGVWFRRPSA